MRKFEITEEQIKYLAQFGYAKDHLIKMFPTAFEPEWEEVPLRSFFPVGGSKGGFVLADSCGAFYPLEVVIRETYKENYKIEDGKIWRRKP